MPKLLKDVTQSQGTQEGVARASSGRLCRPSAKVRSMEGKHLT
jgi:hypothetical protein